MTNKHQSDAADALSRAIRNRWSGWHVVETEGDAILVSYDADHVPALVVSPTYGGFAVRSRAVAAPKVAVPQG